MIARVERSPMSLGAAPSDDADVVGRSVVSIDNIATAYYETRPE